MMSRNSPSPVRFTIMLPIHPAIAPSTIQLRNPIVASYPLFNRLRGCRASGPRRRPRPRAVVEYEPCDKPEGGADAAADQLSMYQSPCRIPDDFGNLHE